jgi:hypothetical protein
VSGAEESTGGAIPTIDEVPRGFCKEFCCAWNKRKLRNGQDGSYCGKTVFPPAADGKRYCAWEWKRIKEKMSLCAKLKKS